MLEGADSAHVTGETRQRASDKVGGRCRDVSAAGRGRPHDSAGVGLGDVPARGLLDPVMTAALRVEVALVGGAVRVGDGVVEVAVDGLGVAGGGGAGLVAGADQVLELAAGDVAGFGGAVVAGVPCDGFGRDVQPLEQVA